MPAISTENRSLKNGSVARIKSTLRITKLSLILMELLRLSDANLDWCFFVLKKRSPKKLKCVKIQSFNKIAFRTLKSQINLLLHFTAKLTMQLQIFDRNSQQRTIYLLIFYSLSWLT